MRAVVQRVSRASVRVDDALVAEISGGLVVLVAVHRDDAKENALKMADRIAKLRIFGDAAGKMNLAIGEVGGSALAVSNFTVYGDTAKNRRPSFIASAPFEKGKDLFDQFATALRALGVPTETGVFGAMMDVELVNDGPVTLIVEA